MVFYKVLWWWPKACNEFKGYEKTKLINIHGNEIYVQNHIQSCAFEHHF